MQYMDQLAPREYAVPEDRIGLQLGSLEHEVSKVLVALDVTEAVVDEAIDQGANMIIAHHAIIYRPLKNLQTSTPMGRIYTKLIKHDIAVFIAHTNLDAAAGGINDLMADALKIQSSGVLEGLAKAHSGSNELIGLGRVGSLDHPMTLRKFAERVKVAFAVPAVRIVGDPERLVRTAAVLGGSGGRYAEHALRAGADVLVTGDIDYHTAHDALAAGLMIVDPGHHAEKIMKSAVAERLQEQLNQDQYDTQAFASRLDTEVFQFV